VKSRSQGQLRRSRRRSSGSAGSQTPRAVRDPVGAAPLDEGALARRLSQNESSRHPPGGPGEQHRRPPCGVLRSHDAAPPGTAPTSPPTRRPSTSSPPAARAGVPPPPDRRLVAQKGAVVVSTSRSTSSSPAGYRPESRGRDPKDVPLGGRKRALIVGVPTRACVDSDALSGEHAPGGGTPVHGGFAPGLRSRSSSGPRSQ